MPDQTEILLVVPTLGRRPTFLENTLQSIADQDVPADVVVVAPDGNSVAVSAASRFGARLLPDPGGLVLSINAGVKTAESHHRYVGWLNDDDALEAGSLRVTASALAQNPAAVIAFGACRYVDEAGEQIWISRAGKWGIRLLSWGPDLVPQPGMLVRRAAWEQVGGLDTRYRLAFDLDFLLRVKRLGPLVDTGHVVSRFRWHNESLTVDDRGANIEESERAKRAALPPALRPIAPLWEVPVRLATRAAVAQMNRRASSTR